MGTKPLKQNQNIKVNKLSEKELGKKSQKILLVKVEKCFLKLQK